MKMKTTKGFTLTELLIVMAIIVVLAAVAIPTFGKQLETARETGDMEIIRNAYTEALSIAALDAEDGKLNGVIGDGNGNFTGDNEVKATISGTQVTNKPADKTVGSTTLTGTDFIWGSVWWGGVNTQTFTDTKNGDTAEVAYATGKYVVKLHSTVANDPDKTMGAYFSQNTESDATKWKYVSNKFMGVTAPNVNTSYDFLVFEFYITDGGSVKLVPDFNNYTGAILPATKGT